MTTPAALCVSASPGPYNGGPGSVAAGAGFGLGRSPSSAGGGYSPAPGLPMGQRSNSAIDPSAVRRASVRAQYAQRSRIVASNNSPLVGLRKSTRRECLPEFDLIFYRGDFLCANTASSRR